MTGAKAHDCPHSNRVAMLFCGSYFVQCATCNATLITIPWFSAESLLKGHLVVTRAESDGREKVAEGSAVHLAPHIRNILMYHERFMLTGPHAVIDESELGDVKNNPLEVQYDYFSRVLEAKPHDECVYFALAQVLFELGNQKNAGDCYDRGVAISKRNWYRKLPFFVVPSMIAGFILWQMSFWLWLAIIIAILGPGLWLYIFRNRKYWIPTVGFCQRAEMAAHIDMVAGLAAKSAVAGKSV